MASKRAPKGSGMQPRKRKDGRWEARATVGYNPATGARICKSIFGKTEREVAQKLREVTAALDKGTYTETLKMSLSQWLTIWLAEYCGNIKESSHDEYRRIVQHDIIPALGNIKLQSLRKDTVQAFVNTLSRGTDRPKPLAPKTVRLVHGTLCKALNQSMDLGYITSNPAARVKLPRIDQKQIEVLDSERLNQFIIAIKGHRFENAYLLAVFCGLRQAEILGLTWDAIDTDTGTIRVYRQLLYRSGRGYAFTSLKNGKERKITPPPYVMEALKRQRNQWIEWKLAAGDLWNDNDGAYFCFCNEIGQHVGRQTLYKAFKKVVAGLNISTMRFHDTRHTAAVTALQSGIDIKAVQTMLGHATASFTMDTYLHTTAQIERENAARMQAHIEMITGQQKLQVVK